MPFIEGLEEQKAALGRIKDNLNQIKKINDSVKVIQEYTASEAKVQQCFEYSFILKDDSLKKVRIPVVIEDNKFVLEAAKKQKDAIVAAVNSDLAQYHISLSPQEKMLLEMDFATEK